MGVGWDLSMLYGGPPSRDGNTSNDTVIYLIKVCATRDESGPINSPSAAGQAINEATNVRGSQGRWERCGTWQSAGKLRGKFAARAGVDVHSWMPGAPAVCPTA